MTVQLDFTLHHVKIRWHFDAFLFLNGPPGKWNAAMKVHPLGSFMKGHLDIYFHLFSIFKILQVYDSLCTKHASKWSATTGHWWLLHVCSKGRKVQSKRGQSEIPLKKSHVSLEMTTYSVIILHEHALTSSILIQQKPRPLLLPAAGMILNLSRLMNN